MMPEGLRMGQESEPWSYLQGSSSVMFPHHQKVPALSPPASPASSLLALTQGATVSRLGQHFQPLPMPVSAVLGIFPKDQMVSLVHLPRVHATGRR